MRFGTLQNVLGEPIETVFDVAARLGFDGVELDWHKESDIADDGPLAPSRRQEIRDHAEKAGVEICSIAAHWLNDTSLAHPEPVSREIGIQGLRDGVALCKDLGAPLLLAPFFGQIDSSTSGIDTMVRNLMLVAPAAKRARVRIAIEHPLPADVAASAIDRVGCPYLGDYWDMANCLALGSDALEEIRTLGSRLAQIHAKEFAPDDEAESGSLQSPAYKWLNKKPLGQGHVPVPEIIKALTQIGYDGYIVLETGTFGDKHTSAMAALDLLRRACE